MSAVKSRDLFGAFLSISGLLVGLAGGAVLAFLSQVLFARYLTPADYGVLAASIALVAILVPVVQFGIGGFWLSAFGREGWDGRRWLRPSIRALALTSPLACLLYYAIAHLSFNGYANSEYLVLMLPMLLLQGAAYLNQVKWQLEHRYRLVSIANMATPFVRAATAIAAVILGLSFGGVFMVFAVLSTLLFCLMTIPLAQFINGNVRLFGHGLPVAQPVTDGSLPVISVFIGSWPYALQNFFEIVLLQTPVVVLASLGTSEEAAMFSVALAIVNATFMLPTAIFAGYIFPKQHRWAAHDQKKLLFVYRLTNGVMVVTGIVIGVAVALLSPYVVPYVFGAEYLTSITLLQLLAVVIPLRFLSTSLGNPLVTADHIYRRLALIAISTVVTVSICAATIPRYGALGGVFGMISGHLVLALLYGFGVFRFVFGWDALKGWFVLPKSG